MRFYHYFAAFFFSLLATGAWAEDYVDIFPGTLVIWQDEPVLIRCDLVKNAYVLVDADGQTATYLEYIRQLGASLTFPVSAVVIGSYKSVDEKNHLVVQSIKQVSKGQSCHLVPPEEPLNI